MDLFWLTVLALVLAAWDRGRLATRLEANSPQPYDTLGLDPRFVPIGGLGVSARLDEATHAPCCGNRVQAPSGKNAGHGPRKAIRIAAHTLSARR